MSAISYKHIEVIGEQKIEQNRETYKDDGKNET